MLSGVAFNDGSNVMLDMSVAHLTMADFPVWVYHDLSCADN